MIVLDTAILVYAVGNEHPLRAPSRAVVQAVREGRIQASTTAGVIQEFVHVRSRRRSREDAAALGREWLALLSPLLDVRPAGVELGLELYRTTELGAFDAVLAGAAIDAEVDALVSADRAFAVVPGLAYVEPGTPECERLLIGG